MAPGRLLGTETEYALRFRPAEGLPHPGNDVLYHAIRAAVERRVAVRAGVGALEAVRHRVVTENGGSLYYEFVPERPDGGLVEGGTPECSAARQLLVYQKAQDRLLTEATREAESDLRERGLGGELALLKNCRDASGHVYGAQENYEVEVARGVVLLCWRLAMALAVASSLVVAAVQWAARLVALAGLALFGIGGVLGAITVVLVLRLPVSAMERFVQVLGRVVDVLDRLETRFVLATFAPTVAFSALAVRWFAFRPYHRSVTAFLATRSVMTGAGTLFPDDAFGLSEKGPAVRRLWRWSVSPDDRGLYEIGHLCKPLLALSWFDVRGVPQLFRRRQRLQIGLSDANLCEVAEFLKVATTSLVLDLAEAGALEGAPELADPVAAVHVVGGDPTLRAWVPLAHSGNMTGLEVQRWYLERAREWVERQEVRDLEAHRVIGLWSQVLDALEQHPESLFGQLDWVTKLSLLGSASDLAWAERKKIDLRYHELGTGYHAWLDEAGACTRLVDPAEVVAASRNPPIGTPAEERGRWVRESSPAPVIPLELPAEAAPQGRVLDFASRRRREPSQP